jgi:hypothetical protein
MASHGIVFGADGLITFGWTYYLKDTCPFGVFVEAGGTVVHLDDALTEAQLVTIVKALTPTTVRADLDASIVSAVEDVIPADTAPEAGEALVYRPGRRRVVSRSPAGVETLIHDFLTPDA